jgi:20S proteasome alpha/beta subunit
LYRTVIGLRGKDGVVFAVEKLVTSKLYESGANKRIFSIDKNTGMVSILDSMIKMCAILCFILEF